MIVLAMAAALSSWSQVIRLEGHKAIRDNRSNVWLCSVPQDVFGTDWMATIEFDSLFSSLVIDGQQVVAGSSFTFDHIQGGKQYPVTATLGDEVITGAITFTWLPVLELKGEFGNEYAPGTVTLNAPDTAQSREDLTAKLKWRGGITNTGDKHKRNYHIKFIDENGDKTNRRLLDLRKDNHWKLDGGQMDPLRIRNRVCSDLWLDMSRHPWHHDIDPTVVNGSNGRLTEVILNGEYHGIYGLIEPIDRKQLGLVKTDETTGEVHGQQWTSKLKYPTYILPPPNNYSATWNGNEVSYPEIEDVFPTDWSTLYNAFEFARRVDAVDDWQTLADSLDYYFDTPVMEDYFIFIVTLQALDNEIKNIYYSCYDKTLGAPRLTLTPWDLDISVGARSVSGLDVSPERPLNWIAHVALGDMFFWSAPHRQHIIDRYWELRKTWLHTDSLVARFQHAVDELEECGAAGREEARWSGDSDLGGATLDLSGEMEYVADWITRRMAYIDENVFVRDLEPGDVNQDGVVNIADAIKLISMILSSDLSQVEADVTTDVNGDGVININDAIMLISIILLGS